jgi:hypothetical protein
MSKLYRGSGSTNKMVVCATHKKCLTYPSRIPWVQILGNYGTYIHMYIDERKNGEFKLKHFNADNKFISGIYNISKSSFIKPPRANTNKDLS